MIGRGRNSTTITLDQLLEKISQIGILAHYFPNIAEIPIVINSPLRHDPRPSFSIYINDDGNIRYFDYSNKEFGGLFDLLSKKFCMDFEDTINKIYTDIGADTGSIVIDNYEKLIKVNKEKLGIKVKVRDWKEHDREFWSRLGINRQWLLFGDIYPISHSFLDLKNDGNWITIPCEKYAYCYRELKDGKETFKLYQPYSKEHKWLNNHDSSVWDLWEKLPETGDILFITSSRKDALTLWANTGIPSTSMQAESTIPKDSVIEELKQRFKRVIVFFDNDYDKSENHGHIMGETLANRYGLEQVEIPSIYESKDPSDYRSKTTKEIFNKTIFKLIHI